MNDVAEVHDERWVYPIQFIDNELRAFIRQAISTPGRSVFRPLWIEMRVSNDSKAKQRQRLRHGFAIAPIDFIHSVIILASSDGKKNQSQRRHG